MAVAGEWAGGDYGGAIGVLAGGNRLAEPANNMAPKGGWIMRAVG